METINDLMAYLSPQRFENDTYKYQTLIPITDTFDPLNPLAVVKKVENYKFQRKYLKKVTDLDYDADRNLTIYVRLDPGEYKYLYYTKRITTPPEGPDITEFRRLDVASAYGWETIIEPELSELTKKIIEPLGHVFIHKKKQELVINSLVTQVISGGFLYDPKDLDSLKDGQTYLMDYIDHEGFGTGTGDTVLKAIGESTQPVKYINDLEDRQVKLHFHEEIRLTYWYPLIKNSLFNKLSLEYYYVNYFDEDHYKNSGKTNTRGPVKFEFLNNIGPKAIQLKFKSIYGLLTFLNGSILRKKIDFNSKEDPDRYDLDVRFIQDYIELVSDYYRSVRHDDEELFRLFYYLPYKGLFEFPQRQLWDFLERTVQSYVTNFGTDKEDIVLKILKSLSKKEDPNTFLNKLIKTINNSSNILELLTSRLHGESYTEFVYLIWSVWSRSDFYSLDPSNRALPKDFTKNPLLIPYNSDTTLSFHTDNASIDWSNNYKNVKVNIIHQPISSKEIFDKFLEIQESIVEEVEHLTDAYVEGNLEEEIKKTQDKLETANGRGLYTYNAFCPVAIVNKSNPEFIFKDGGDEKELVTIMPAFILLAREERAFWSNLMTAGEYLVDVLSLAGGYLSVLRGAKIFSAFNAGESIALNIVKNIVKGSVKSAAGSIFILSGAGRGLMKLTETEDTVVGQLIGEILFYLEIAAMIGEIGVGLRLWMKKAAEKAAKSKEVLKLKNEAKEIILKNTDKETGIVKRTKEVIEAEERLAAFKTVDELASPDFMSKNKTHQLGGKIVKAKRLRKLRGELKKRGILLILEQDAKVKRITNLFKTIYVKGFKFDNAQDLFRFMKEKSVGGAFDARTKQFILTKDPSEYLLFHEKAHLQHFEELGDAYHSLTTLEKEMYVFEEIWKKKHLWTPDELQHSLNYINDVKLKANQKLIH